jgi:hypothetical protein
MITSSFKISHVRQNHHHSRRGATTPDAAFAMRVGTAAVVSAIAAAGLAPVAHAAHPAQLVIATAAGCSFLAALGRRSPPSQADWLTVHLLLAANLGVFGISEVHELGVPLAAVAIVSGLALAAGAARSYL